MEKKDLTTEEKLTIIQNNGGNQDDILKILLELQNASKDGYIDEESITLVAKELKMTESKVFEVVTSYSMLKSKPQAKYVLKICNSTPCHFSKADAITSVLSKELEVKIGETTQDNMFAFHYIPCVGACDIGPVIKIKDTVYGDLNEKKIKQLINDLKSGLRDQ